MKKMFKCAIFVVLLGLFISACSAKEKANNEDEKEVKEEKTIEKPEIKMENLVPNPKEYFINSDKFEAITDDNAYYVYMDNVLEDEWNKYIESCEALGYWTNDEYKSDYSWYTYSSDGKYELLIDRYGDKNNYLSIAIKENDKENNEE